jgi:hypothetical protein
LAATQTQTLWMKKGKLFLRHRYGKAERMALDPDSPRTSEQGRRHTETNRLCPKRAHNLINLLSQTCAYAHEIAFTWCNTRDIHVGARLNKCNTAVRTCMMAIWPDEATRAQGVVRPVD